MKGINFQLARLYRSGRFYGYGIAVNGELLTNQISTTIETNARDLPVIKAEFRLDDINVNDPIIIELPQSLIREQGEGESNPCS